MAATSRRSTPTWSCCRTTNVGYFLVLNSDGAERGLFGAAHLFRTAFFSQFIDRHFPAPALAELPTATTAREHARLVAGEYQMSRRGVGDFTELETLLNRAAMNLVITANEDGTIETPPLLDFEKGQVRKWREVGPFVWREVGGEGWLDVQVENGRVKALLPRDLYSFVLQPIGWTKSARINVVLMSGAFLVLMLTVLLWPLTRLLRPALWEEPSSGMEADPDCRADGSCVSAGVGDPLGKRHPIEGGRRAVDSARSAAGRS